LEFIFTHFDYNNYILIIKLFNRIFPQDSVYCHIEILITGGLGVSFPAGGGLLGWAQPLLWERSLLTANFRSLQWDRTHDLSIFGWQFNHYTKVEKQDCYI
jgi:hypothetical protein